MVHILKCSSCGSYGLEVACPCGHQRNAPKPAKFSPQDRYGSYRREAKKHDMDHHPHQ